MAPCFAPLCNSGHYNNVQCHTFRPDSSVAVEWVKILSKIREDKVFDPNNDYHRLCDKHFETSQILSKDSFIVNQEVVTIERQRWRLLPGTVPTIFPNLPSYRQGKMPLKRKQRNLFQEFPTKKSRTDFSKMLENWETIKTDFNQWTITIERENNKAVFFNNASGTHKIIQVQEDMTFNATVAAKKVPTPLYDDLPDYTPTDAPWLTCILERTEIINKCQGAKHHSSVRTLRNASKIGEIWFSENCHQLCLASVCTPCKLTQNKINRKVLNAHKPNKQKLKSIQNRTQYNKKLLSTLKEKQKEMKSLKTELKLAKELSVSNIMENLKMPKLTKLSILQALKCAKQKSSRGMRYQTDWLLESLLLKIKSPAAYNHLRKSKVLPLPHPRTLQNLISGQKCEFGFNEMALQSIKNYMNGKEIKYRQGVLLFDEVKLRESLEFNKGSCRFDGFINYAEYSGELIPEENQNFLADHALVLMYRPLNAKWVQPIAAFATKGAAKGNALQKLILEAVIKLEANEAQVVCVIGDGAKPNKNFWNRFGISGKRGRIVNKISHPVDSSRFLHFICDVPHLFKCIRNHFRKYNKVTFNGKPIDFNFYEKLLFEDAKRLCGLRKCPKLTKSHIEPNCFEKMSVSLMTQLFSRSVSTGIQFYRQLKVSGFRNSENTETFTEYLNDLFDAINGKLPKQGLRLNSIEYKRIKEFLVILNQEDFRDTDNVKVSFNSFASTETLAALRVTLASILDISTYLIDVVGFEYVLPNKLNQDPLERFFGLIRGSGGHEDHPTICNFLQLYRILSLYSPIKKITNGNVSSDDAETVLVSFETSLRNSAKAVKKSKLEWKESIEEQLFGKLDTVQSLEVNSSLPEADANIVYYLCGYMIYKCGNYIKCDDCLISIQGSESNLPKEANLSKILDFGSSLKYPSTCLFYMIFNNVENALVKMLDKGDLYGDIVSRIIESIGTLPIIGIGCGRDAHSFSIICKLIPFYIILRIQFYSRTRRNLLGHGKATRNKRKLSKLESM